MNVTQFERNPIKYMVKTGSKWLDKTFLYPEKDKEKRPLPILAKVDKEQNNIVQNSAPRKEIPRAPRPYRTAGRMPRISKKMPRLR